MCIFIVFIPHIQFAYPNTYHLQHVDRYLRLKRQKTLNTKTPGVAIIEYEDGETEMVNLQIETFRNYQEDDEGDSDNKNNNRQINNFDLIIKGEMIEILWPLADMYFPCKIISYTKLLNSSKKRSRKTVDEVKEGDSKMESIPKKKKHTWVDKKMEAKSQQLKSSDEEEQINNISDESLDNYDSDRLVERLNHDNPLFDDEPEDDSSDNDDDEEEESDPDSDNDDSPNKQPDPVFHGGNNQARKLTFEEQWRLKLQRTQEMMNRESLDKSNMSSLMARQL